MGVACGLIAASRGPVSIAQTGESPIVLREYSTCVQMDVVHAYALRRWVELLARDRNYSSLLVGGSTCAGRAAAAQQQEQRHSSNPRARSVRASLCPCVLPRVPIIPLSTLAFHAGPSRRRRRSWASHSTWTLPHRPAGYSTSLRTPLALPFGAEKGVVSQQKRAERRRVFRLAVRVAVSLSV